MNHLRNIYFCAEVNLKIAQFDPTLIKVFELCLLESGFYK